ncbi:hypothetical protein GCM10010320_68050 [Streptomyces caelestis]|nr:hypothetical protein GCM10010320_68050 [Streptomyces caelestis]
MWALVSDVTRMPELSEELQSARWADGAADPAAGARFAGRNKHVVCGRSRESERGVTAALERIRP